MVERIDTSEISCSGGVCNDLYDNASTLKYIAFASNQQGFAYFAPYRFMNSAFFNVNSTSTPADIETDYREIKWGMGFETNEYFSWGFTVDWLFRFADVTNLNTGEKDDIDENEFGFALGAQGKLPLENILPKGHKFTYGVTFRSGTDSEVEDDATFDSVEGVPGRPQALNYGIGYTLPLPVILDTPSVLVFNYEIDNLEYEDILNGLRASGTGNAVGDLEEERTAFGFEWQLLPSFLQNGSLFVRFGQSETEIDAKGDPDTSIIGNIETTAYGFGIKLGNVVFDIARESRDLEFASVYNNADQDVELTAMSFSWLF